MYQLVLSGPRTPKPARFLLRLTVGYALMPFDLIPDFIPVIKHLDDTITVPALVIAALRMIPREIVDELRDRMLKETSL